MDEVVVWSNLVLTLAVLPWLVYVVVLVFFLLSILYGSVSLSIFPSSASLSVASWVEKVQKGRGRKLQISDR